MLSIRTNRQVGLVAAFTVLAWLGEYIHNLVELPQLTPLSPENSLPALAFLLFFLGWWRLPYKRLTAILMLAYAALHLVGGAILSVIPFPFLPFYPEQSLRHYLAHIVYGLAQCQDYNKADEEDKCG
jgi:hypothetical protein